jgi:hypothetical protein
LARTSLEGDSNNAKRSMNRKIPSASRSAACATRRRSAAIARTYIGSMPGRIVQALKTAGSSNPVFMLDEIDKISAGIQGDPGGACWRLLDPAAARQHVTRVTH